MGDVLSLRGFATKEGLIDIAQDPDVEQVMIVCFFKDGITDAGWTKNISHSQLVFGSEVLKSQVNDRVFPHRHEADDIIY